MCDYEYLLLTEETRRALEALHRRSRPSDDGGFVVWLDCEIEALFWAWDTSWLVHVDPERCTAEVGPVSEEVAWTLRGIAIGEGAPLEDVYEGFAQRILAAGSSCRGRAS